MPVCRRPLSTADRVSGGVHDDRSITRPLRRLRFDDRPDRIRAPLCCKLRDHAVPLPEDLRPWSGPNPFCPTLMAGLDIAVA